MSFDRVPPHDFDAERSALHVVVSRGLIPPELETIDTSTFYEPAHAQIWACVEGLLRDGHACDAVAVNSCLITAGRHAAARRLLDVVDVTGIWSADTTTIARVLTEAAGRRHIIDVTEAATEDAYTSEADYQTILERTEARLASVPTESRDDVVTLLQVADFIGLDVPEPDWIMPGLLAKGERMILTGDEGLGKSTLMRQIAMCGAAGISPFTGQEIPRLKVLMIDAENPTYIMQKRLQEIRQAIHAHSSSARLDSMWLDRRPDGMDLSQASDRRWLARRFRAVNPDLLVIGPAYKLHQGMGEEKDEVIARTVTSVLDDLRGEAGLVLEHHAGNEQGGRERPIRPFGSSLWRRWPEFGLGLRAVKPPTGVSKKDAAKRRVADLEPWRGSRDERGWPSTVESGGGGLPWVESVGYAR